MDTQHEIDVSSLERLTTRLEEALRDHKIDSANLYILDSVIKRFELCYLLAIRLIERYLQDFAPVPPDSDATFRELIESATEQGVTTSSLNDWIAFRKARNKTAHTYEEQAARELVPEAEAFLPVARSVLTAIQRRVTGHD